MSTWWFSWVWFSDQQKIQVKGGLAANRSIWPHPPFHFHPLSHLAASSTPQKWLAHWCPLQGLATGNFQDVQVGYPSATRDQDMPHWKGDIVTHLLVEVTVNLVFHNGGLGVGRSFGHLAAGRTRCYPDLSAWKPRAHSVLNQIGVQGYESTSGTSLAINLVAHLH